MPLHYLSEIEQGKLHELRLRDPFVDDVLSQVDRVLSSRRFLRLQQRAQDFLRYIVAMTLIGQSDHVKETTIAIAVFGESADFNPVESGKVRVAGTDLRQRLKAYAADEGHDDPIQILIPDKTFVPTLMDRRVTVAVSLFESRTAKQPQEHLGAVISDEIAFVLNQSGWIRATRVPRIELGMPPFRFGLSGLLGVGTDIVHVHVSLADLRTGRIVHWQSVEDKRDDVLKLAGDIARTLLVKLQPSDHASPRNVAVRTRKRADTP